MTPSTREDILTFYEQGYTIKQLADKYNYTFNHIYNLVRLYLCNNQSND